jgi:hypothetical protein
MTEPLDGSLTGPLAGPLSGPLAGPLAGLVVLGGLPSGHCRLQRWGATCIAGPLPAALHRAAGLPGVAAICWLPPGHLPIRPVADIAAALLDGAEHVGPHHETGWCVTVEAARRMLARLGRLTPDADAVHAAALLAACGRLAPPPCHAGPATLHLPDLPAAFASGRPFAGPFAAEDTMASARALGATEARRRATATRLPPMLRPVGAPPSPRPGEILALVVARQEELRLPDALASLRALGVERAIVVDNCSSDSTREIAAQAGAHVILAEEDYAASNYGVTWTNAVLDAYGRGHWVLVVDADEQLVFPGSDRVGLRGLTAHLDALGSEALRTVLLDCFPPGPLAACSYARGQRLRKVASHFEPPRLRRERIADFPYTLEYGGIRERLFFPEADPRRPTRWLRQRLYNLGLRVPGLRGSAGFARLAPPRSPTLTKIPLLRWRDGAALVASTHRVASMAMAPDQPSGVLLHFKFLQDFHARALDAVARGAHFDGSREYRRYLARIEADATFSLAGPRSRVLADTDDLVGLGVMRDTPGWQRARGVG